jgi:hypothetical protein
LVTEEFRVDPAQYVTGVERERAVRALKCYRSTKSGERRYSGSLFDELVRTSDPSRFTANDLVAINMLSVDVPRETAAWLLSDPGWELSRHLTEIPVDLAAWDRSAEVTQTAAPAELWRLLGQRKGLRHARTTKSKLLAAKRPALLPIHDRYVGEGLGYTDADDFWALWRKRFAADDGADLLQSVEDVRRAADAEGMTILRVLDVVIWMRVHGWKVPPQEELKDFARPLGQE